MNDIDNLSDKTTSLQELLASQQTILLSTASGNSVPDLSVAPFVRDQAGCFYIFISELATHTDNLLNNPQVSVMFIRPESESNNLFARERAVFNCKARKIERSEPLYTSQLKAFQDKFGEVVSLLQTLTDFHLFALCPESGRYIMGFGQAYMINIQEGKVSPLNKNSS
ncbi:MAG: HugZ family pyridoxamine 5'-phosphate oxidase [Methylobacter sp.]